MAPTAAMTFSASISEQTHGQRSFPLGRNHPQPEIGIPLCATPTRISTFSQGMMDLTEWTTFISTRSRRENGVGWLPPIRKQDRVRGTRILQWSTTEICSFSVDMTAIIEQICSSLTSKEGCGKRFTGREPGQSHATGRQRL